MHDGECPACHALFDSRAMTVPGHPSIGRAAYAGEDETCPSCGFTITADERRAAIRAFAPVMDRNLELFEDWRRSL
jgi:hypothetical protein